MKAEARNTLDGLILRYDELDVCRADIVAVFEMICHCFRNSSKVMICGNGGSAADSEHIVGELMKGFKHSRPLGHNEREKLTGLFDDGGYIADNLQGALPAVSLVNNVSLSSAFANDVAADMIFAQQVYGLGNAGDVVIGISTSGNAVNVINALKTARAFDMHTIGLTGGTGGKMLKYCETSVKVPQTETYLVQELHLPVYHTLCAMLEEEFFGKK